jgi:hypothetical protein
VAGRIYYPQDFVTGGPNRANFHVSRRSVCHCFRRASFLLFGHVGLSFSRARSIRSTVEGR